MRENVRRTGRGHRAHRVGTSSADAISVRSISNNFLLMFTGEAISTGGSHYKHSLYVEIGKNHHLSLIS